MFFVLNEALYLLMESKLQTGGWCGWQAEKVQDCHTADSGLSMESTVWLNLGMESKLVDVRERFWFCLKVNKHIECEATVCFFLIKPNHNLYLA